MTEPTDPLHTLASLAGCGVRAFRVGAATYSAVLSDQRRIEWVFDGERYRSRALTRQHDRMGRQPPTLTRHGKEDQP